MELVDVLDSKSSAARRAGSSPATGTKLNDPTQSEQIVVSCLDWVGLFFACSPYISRDAGFFGFECYVSPAFLRAVVPVLDIFYFSQALIYPITPEGENSSLRGLLESKVFWFLVLMLAGLEAMSGQADKTNEF